MNLTARLQESATTRHAASGAGALADPAYAEMLARARLRLRRDLEAALPDAPVLSDADIKVVEAFERHGLPPVSVILFGQDKVGAKLIAARLELRDGQPHAHLGVATLDEWGEMTFRGEPAPAPRSQAS